MNSRFAALALALLFAVARADAAPGQYETLDYYVQQMIAAAAAKDATGAQTFREQLEQLARPEAGDSAKAQPHRRQGSDYLNQNQLKEALAAFRQAFIFDPADREIARQLGLTYLRLNRLKEAERLSVYALSLAPAQAPAWLILGEIYGQAGDGQRAAGAFVNAYRCAENPAQLAETLRRLASTSRAPALQEGVRLALEITGSEADAKPAAGPTMPAPAPEAPAPTTAPISAAGSAAKAGSPIISGPAAASAPTPAHPEAISGVLGMIARRLESLAGPTGKAGPEPGAPAAARAEAESPGQRIYRRGIPLTCLIATSRDGKTANLGSGLLVSADGHVITNQHVIEKTGNLAVRCGGRESAATVLKRSKKPDLALLATALTLPDAFVFNESYSQTLIGQDVFVIGNPYGLEGTFSTGVISGLREIDGVRHLQISAPVSPGNSGGPVMLADGTVIGIAAMGLKAGQNLNFAIASVEVIASGLFDPSRMQRRPPVAP
ncbi:MAG: trypsin-like peptidase domain-containing protein [Candidatus Competibacteraceae bacterium]|nr:trypsin-like peptidase domain-containing protein [Candidatus Competibacteraceae bacterium]